MHFKRGDENMKRKNKKLTRLILGALLASGAMLTPGVASATDVEVGDTDDVMFAYNGYKGDDAAAGGIDGTQTGHNTTVSGGKVTYTVWGGKSKIDDVSDNTVHIKGGEVGNVYGGAIAGEPGWTGSADASGNTVNITGGTVSGSVFGGHTIRGNATGNTVNIYGGTIGGNVYGGMSQTSATNNTVNIYAVGDIRGGIYAGQALNTTTWESGISTGNVVNILGTITISGYLDGDGTQTINIASKDNKVSAIYADPQNINFFLPTDTVNGDTMLTVTGEAQVNGTAIGVAAQEGLTSLSKGDSVTLIKAGTLNADGFTTSDATTVKASAPTGITTSEDYEFDTNH